MGEAQLLSRLSLQLTEPNSQGQQRAPGLGTAPMAVSGLIGKDMNLRRKKVFSHPLGVQLPQKTPV